METTPRPAVCDVSEAAPVLPTGADAYLEHLSKEQTRFLAALADANTMLPGPTSQLARVAAIQSRLTQEFLDAQRAIIKRRAETEATVAAVAIAAEAEADRLFACARDESVMASVCGPTLHAAPTGSPVAKPAPVMALTPGVAAAGVWPAPGSSSPAEVESLARLIDGAFEGAEPDGAAMKRQLRELLDEWWRIENQEDKAAIDDANARAAMRVHVATVESNQIVRAAAVREEFAAPRFAYEPPKHVPPLVAALDTTSHEDLDDMLSSLLDALDAPIGLSEADVAPTIDVASTVDAVAAGRPVIDARSAMPFAAPPAGAIPVPVPFADPFADPFAQVALPYGRPDSLNDETAAPQEAFDRFWGSLTARGSRGRDWVFMQVLFPAVAVIAVLALVLAVVG
jgi:hypothetical protein